MSDARTEILERIRAAAVDAVPAIRRQYRGAQGLAGSVDQFAERVAEYRAVVHRCDEDEVTGVLTTLIDGRAFGAAPGLEWAVSGAIEDNPALSVEELDALAGVITGCALGIAATGTIVLDHAPGQGRRALTLVPDRHIVVVRAGQLVPDVPDAIASLDPHRPQTWISGPSAASDIEFNRVEGVHGPRILEVVLVLPSQIGHGKGLNPTR